MIVVVAMDSFKGSLTSLEAGEAVRRGILRACPESEVQVFPLADGGEGSLACIAPYLGGEEITLTVTGPLGAPVNVTENFLAYLFQSFPAPYVAKEVLLTVS